jgi:luciferase family oxidoreductase group 1
MNVAAAVPLSVLDLSVLSSGATSGDALRTTAALAQRADQLGFTRFWVAEHHNMPSVACTSPTVLIAHLAAVTERIRVGSGGVMLPNHAPLVVAEQFAMLEALHPHRIDVGIGRAPGTDQSTAMALRRSPDMLGAEDFPQHLIDLMGLLGDVRGDSGMWNQFRATPVATSVPDIFLLGSSGYSAQLAGYLGLPFGFAHHFDMGGTLQVADLYRESFRPSARLEQPYLVVTANVMAADTYDEAVWHAAPSQLMKYNRRTGRIGPLPTPAEAAADPDIAEARRMPTTRIVGDVTSVVSQLNDLAIRTRASELMVTSVAHDVSARLHSLDLLAGAWDLGKGSTAVPVSGAASL